MALIYVRTYPRRSTERCASLMISVFMHKYVNVAFALISDLYSEPLSRAHVLSYQSDFRLIRLRVFIERNTRVNIYFTSVAARGAFWKA